MQVFRKAALLAVLLCFVTAAAQATQCADIVTDALAAVQDACAATGRNQACYGNVSIDAAPREGVEELRFEQQGDLANVADLQTLRLRGLDAATNEWGVALMQLQANLPDALPGQNVTFLLFGDVEIENAVTDPAAITLEATATGGVNIRTAPGTNANIAGSLASGESVTINGRNADGTWVRIQIPDSDSLGWVSAPLLTITGDVDALAVVDALDGETPYTPMQAFYFRTGIVDPLGCADAPPDGILIQTPEGAGEIMLRANDVDIQLGSTAYLQAVADDEMTISVIEGEGQVTAAGETVIVPAGASVGVPIDAELRAVGAPQDVQPYDADALAALPIEPLPRAIEIAAPADEQTLAAARGDDQGAGGDFSGGAFDPSMFEGLDPALFCPIFDQMLRDEGVSRQEYIAAVREVMGYIPEADQASLEAFIQLLAACP
jgi:hypothetical protein